MVVGDVKLVKEEPRRFDLLALFEEKEEDYLLVSFVALCVCIIPYG